MDDDIRNDEPAYSIHVTMEELKKYAEINDLYDDLLKKIPPHINIYKKNNICLQCGIIRLRTQKKK